MKSLLLERICDLAGVLKESIYELIYLDPQHIYDFYYLAYYYDKAKDKEGSSGNKRAMGIIKRRLRRIKEDYLDVFRQLLVNQIEKYIKRKRYSGNMSIEEIASEISFEKINSLMNRTFRSDMTRKNERWNLLSKYVMELKKAEDIEDIVRLIDAINNTTHNTKTLVLGKFANNKELLKAFNTAHETKLVNELRQHADRGLVNDIDAVFDMSATIASARERMFGNLDFK